MATLLTGTTIGGITAATVNSRLEKLEAKVI